MVETHLDSFPLAGQETKGGGLDFGQHVLPYMDTGIKAKSTAEAIIDGQMVFASLPEFTRSDVAALHPPGTAIEEEPPADQPPIDPPEQPIEQPIDQEPDQPSNKQPEVRLEEILNNLAPDASPEEYALAEKEVEGLFVAQEENINASRDAYETYPVDEDLYDDEAVDQTLKAVSPELQKNGFFKENLDKLPNLIFSGQTDMANLIKQSLQLAIRMSDTGMGGDKLDEYFKTLDAIAADNPEIVDEYTSVRETYEGEIKTRDDMLKRLEDRPLGNYMFNK